jgi:hypothetical protein
MIPKTLEDFTVGWVSDALAPALAETGAQVASVDASYHDAPGQTADTVILRLAYDGKTGLPQRMFGKINTRNEETMAMVMAMDLYRREVAFYTQVDDVGLPVPGCYYGAFDPERYEFVLLLEDLSSGICPSWGISEAQALDAIALLPAFHAKWWNRNEAKGFDWAIQLESDDFWERWRTDLPVNLQKAKEQLGPALPGAFIDIVDLALEKYDAFLEYLTGRPFALVHGDYHFKQIFFPRPDGSGRLAVFDWQFPYVAPGPWDLARIAVLALPVATRRRLGPDILDAYLDGLAGHGVVGYGPEDLGQDLASGCLINLLIHTNAIGATDTGILAEEASAFGVDWREVLIHRVVDAASEFGTRELLESL